MYIVTVTRSSAVDNIAYNAPFFPAFQQVKRLKLLKTTCFQPLNGVNVAFFVENSVEYVNNFA